MEINEQQPILEHKAKNLWKIIALFLILIITLGVIFFGYNHIQTKARTEGYNSGIYAIAFEQTTTGNIYYLNESSHLNYISQEDLCK